MQGAAFAEGMAPSGELPDPAVFGAGASACADGCGTVSSVAEADFGSVCDSKPGSAGSGRMGGADGLRGRATAGGRGSGGGSGVSAATAESLGGGSLRTGHIPAAPSAAPTTLTVGAEIYFELLGDALSAPLLSRETGDRYLAELRAATRQVAPDGPPAASVAEAWAACLLKCMRSTQRAVMHEACDLLAQVFAACGVTPESLPTFPSPEEETPKRGSDGGGVPPKNGLAAQSPAATAAAAAAAPGSEAFLSFLLVLQRARVLDALIAIVGRSYVRSAMDCARCVETAVATLVSGGASSEAARKLALAFVHQYTAVLKRSDRQILKSLAFDFFARLSPHLSAHAGRDGEWFEAVDALFHAATALRGDKLWATPANRLTAALRPTLRSGASRELPADAVTASTAASSARGGSPPPQPLSQRGTWSATASAQRAPGFRHPLCPGLSALTRTTLVGTTNQSPKGAAAAGTGPGPGAAGAGAGAARAGAGGAGAAAAGAGFKSPPAAAAASERASSGDLLKFSPIKKSDSALFNGAHGDCGSFCTDAGSAARTPGGEQFKRHSSQPPWGVYRETAAGGAAAGGAAAGGHGTGRGSGAGSGRDSVAGSSYGAAGSGVHAGLFTPKGAAPRSTSVRPARVAHGRSPPAAAAATALRVAAAPPRAVSSEQARQDRCAADLDRRQRSYPSFERSASLSPVFGYGATSGGHPSLKEAGGADAAATAAAGGGGGTFLSCRQRALQYRTTEWPEAEAHLKSHLRWKARSDGGKGASLQCAGTLAWCTGTPAAAAAGGFCGCGCGYTAAAGDEAAAWLADDARLAADDSDWERVVRSLAHFATFCAARYGSRSVTAGPAAEKALSEKSAHQLLRGLHAAAAFTQSLRSTVARAALQCLRCVWTSVGDPQRLLTPALPACFAAALRRAADVSANAFIAEEASVTLFTLVLFSSSTRLVTCVLDQVPHARASCARRRLVDCLALLAWRVGSALLKSKHSFDILAYLAATAASDPTAETRLLATATLKYVYYCTASETVLISAIGKRPAGDIAKIMHAIKGPLRRADSVPTPPDEEFDSLVALLIPTTVLPPSMALASTA